MPATFDDVARVAAALPDASEGDRYGGRTWEVGGKVFAWERGFSKADIKRFGKETPPDGPILAVRTDGLHDKEAALQSQTMGFFTIPHFNNYPAILIQLKKVTKTALKDALLDGWLACAPPKLAKAYLEKRQLR